MCVSVCILCAGIQMEMTAPVLVKIPEETKTWEPAVYTLNFPLSAAYQDKPPVPTNDKVRWAWWMGWMELFGALAPHEVKCFYFPSIQCNLIVEFFLEDQ